MYDFVDNAWEIPAQLQGLAPEPAGLLETLNMAAWQRMPADLLEEVRLRVADMIGNIAGRTRRSRAAAAAGLSEAKIEHLGDYFRSEDYSEQEREVLEFVEQFVMDVSMFTEQNTEALERRYGAEGMYELITALYLTEFTQRLEIVATALIESNDKQALPSVATDLAGYEGSTLKQILADYQAAAMRGRELDPVLTEMVRLRCARTHNCRICQTLRAADARVAGADEAMADKVDFYENSDLDERIKTALRITDAFITTPDLLTDALISQARSTFSDAQLAELCFDVIKWSTQKIKISLRLDGADALPTDSSGVSFFQFGDDGQPAGFSTTAGSAIGRPSS
jgi:alkylhydroperoxidase family enzyme